MIYILKLKRMYGVSVCSRLITVPSLQGTGCYNVNIHCRNVSEVKLPQTYEDIWSCCSRDVISLQLLISTCAWLLDGKYLIEPHKLYISVNSSAIIYLVGVTLMPEILHHMKNFIAFVTLLARCWILASGIPPAPLAHHSRFKEIHCVHMEIIRCTLRRTSTSFKKTWGPFKAYADTLTLCY